MIQHRNIGHDWQFSRDQIELLDQYFEANKLLVDCLDSDCYVSRKVRQEIEESLLLPYEDVKSRAAQGKWHINKACYRSDFIR